MEQPECSPAIPATARAARAGGPTARVALTARHPSALSARARLTGVAGDGVAWRWGGQGPWNRGQGASAWSTWSHPDHLRSHSAIRGTDGARAGVVLALGL